MLIRYQDKHRLRTIRQIIGRWAPTVENDTAAYVEAVAVGTGLPADKTLDLHAYSDLKPLIEAIIKHENGQQPYTAAQIDKALVLVGVEPPAKNLQHTRTIKGGKAATAATVGLGAIEAAKEALDPARDALQTLVPYLESPNGYFWPSHSSALA